MVAVSALALFSMIGVLAGFLAGLLGIGGGVIIVPGLAFALRHFSAFPPGTFMHIAISSSLASIIVTTLVTVITQSRRKNILWPLVKKLAPGIVIGTLIGTSLVTVLPTTALRIIFGVFLAIIAIHMLFSTKAETHPVSAITLEKTWIKLVAGTAIGFASGLLGIGGGAVAVPIFLRMGLESHRATATSSACAFLLSIIGTLIFTMTNSQATNLPGVTGFVYWPAVICIAIASIIFVPLGAKVAQRLSGDNLKHVFAIFMLVVSAIMIM